ncbi:hypothetical protein SG34_018625 [Thalassomonas viridans]|uniref:Uncharacterized protein n=1 Tax=Thalassomonas viridans TaxID=137584 RepID=A0AAF0C773_9GAMM|nr:hypothetical protein [Thalassomonas viridans]WDE03403.1 hypothetical protein SG34_018625 [Thalassomonas viridans]
MERVVRAVPVKSKQALQAFAAQSAEWPAAEKKQFLSYFGDAVEQWYFQEIEGKPYVIAIAEGTRLSEGYAKYPDLDDPYFNWFSEQVLALCGVDLRKIPHAAESELIYTLSP